MPSANVVMAHPRMIALVAAAGGGSRFGGRVPKQYADLRGEPVIARTMDRLVQALPRAEVVVALAPDDHGFESKLAPWQQCETLRCGGATRGDTVANALAALAPRCADDDWVLVHDAARPCVPIDAVLRLVADLEDDAVGGLHAIPVSDTLKRAEPGAPDRVLRTEDRANLWQAQTPQMFRYQLLMEALTEAGTDAVVTDEASALEKLGYRPKLVMGDSRNLKVTYPEDLALAELILKTATWS